MADPAAAPAPEEPRDLTDIDLGAYLDAAYLVGFAANVPEAMGHPGSAAVSERRV
jgi:hypothetical protein